ncbi:MAG TPA: tetratricopeptide repeat protein, partial [Kofleriaceae bacterium]|nr:tetratricopeptide repeat protein [Kofleriaceae bacterium]
AHLAAGELDDAAKDLDAALAKSPDDEAALLARAEVDLARGDAKAAAARLASRAGAPAASGGLLVTYAAALRASGAREQAKPILEKLAGAGGTLAGRAWLERARLARDESDLAGARAAYAKAVEALPRGQAGAPWIDARLEGAVLSIDLGEVATGKEQLDRLVADAPGDGRVLVEAARAHTLLGDLAASKDLLDKAEAAPTAPRWKVARERGRLAIRKRDVTQAVESLERAASLAPDDGETRLLLIDANILGKDDTAARRGLGDVLARFKGRPEAALAGGRVAYYFSKDSEARTDFQQARDALVKAKAPARAVADATYWLGRVRYDDNPDEARKLLVEATTLDPTLADAYVFLGLIDVDKNAPGSAVTWFQKATTLDPENIDTWFDLGQAAVAAKQPLIAKTAYTEYLHRAPNGDNAADARAALKKL